MAGSTVSSIQTADLIVGIDVGGTKKGFHLASLKPGEFQIRDIRHCQSVVDVCTWVRTLVAESTQTTKLLLAIDCPPRSQLTGEKTRLSERQLHRQGFRVQWTRRTTHAPAEWMDNGQRLWEALSKLPDTYAIETFPTVATRHLCDSNVQLPLRLLAQHAGRREWKDFMDAAICADVGDRYLRGRANCVGVDPDTAELDELGPIWF